VLAAAYANSSNSNQQQQPAISNSNWQALRGNSLEPGQEL